MVNNKKVDSIKLDYLTQSTQLLKSEKLIKNLIKFPLIWYIVGLSRPDIGRKIWAFNTGSTFPCHTPYDRKDQNEDEKKDQTSLYWGNSAG